MKAVNTELEKRGDDKNFNRLLDYLRYYFRDTDLKLVQLRHCVYYLKTNERAMILKGYPAYRSLKLQETFTATLKAEGFHDTYTYLPSVNGALFFDNLFYGCIEFIEPHDYGFSFFSHKERKIGFELVEKFHIITSNFEARYRTLLPTFQAEKKWMERRNMFISNLPILSCFLTKEIVNELLHWSEWALNGMQKYSEIFEREPSVILHGDLAHHNFLRSKSGQLKLIDFDLISIGPPVFDVLQYSNRICPFLNWSLTDLFKYKYVKKYMDNKAFLYALAYPADLFREWNRIIRNQTYSKPEKIQTVLDMTYRQFFLRKQFFQKLKMKLV